ncbi:unnamed protein product [Polarella glacialis]|uniref:Pseudouridine synthase RsuA/RluA-like domain-containing protein n=1 Tax=Polarella glacialis TaxID=89957 RepID=A0A813HXX0_POLGL|nr:unnamed protein product [Polarella glacialis]
MPTASAAQSEVSYSASISACERGRRWEVCLALLQEMPLTRATPNTISFNAAISACEGEAWPAALRLLQEMSARRIEASTMSYNAASNSCDTGWQWARALHLLLSHLPHRGLAADSVSLGASVGLCGKANLWQLGAVLLRSNSRGHGVALTTVSYSAAIKMYAVSGGWECGLDCLHALRRDRMSPDTIGHNALLTACQKHGLWDLALRVLLLMPTVDVAPDAISYNAAAIASASQGRHRLHRDVAGKAAPEKQPAHFSLDFGRDKSGLPVGPEAGTTKLLAKARFQLQGSEVLRGAGAELSNRQATGDRLLKANGFANNPHEPLEPIVKCMTPHADRSATNCIDRSRHCSIKAPEKCYCCSWAAVHPIGQSSCAASASSRHCERRAVLLPHPADIVNVDTQQQVKAAALQAQKGDAGGKGGKGMTPHADRSATNCIDRSRHCSIKAPEKCYCCSWAAVHPIGQSSCAASASSRHCERRAVLLPHPADIVNVELCCFRIQSGGHVLVDVHAPELAVLAAKLAEKANELGVRGVRPKALRGDEWSSCGRVPACDCMITLANKDNVWRAVPQMSTAHAAKSSLAQWSLRLWGTSRQLRLCDGLRSPFALRGSVAEKPAADRRRDPGAAAPRTDLLSQVLALGPQPSAEEVRRLLSPELERWEQNPRLATGILSCLARQGLPDAVRQVFCFMKDNLLEVNVFHCTKTMSSCAQGRHWQLALVILREMPEFSVAPSDISYNVAIGACGKSGQWTTALDLLYEMPGIHVMPDHISYNAAINACATCGQWQEVLALLQDMPTATLSPDVISYSAAISSCGTDESWQLALEFLRLIPLLRISNDVISYSAAISACRKGLQWQLSLELLREMPASSLLPNEISLNAAMSACEQSGQWQHALGLLRSMPRAGLSPGVISYSVALNACLKGQQWALALALLKELPRARVKPNHRLFYSAIGACAVVGLWHLALSLLGNLSEMRMAPDEICYNSAISTCQKCGQWEISLCLLRDMPRAKLQPDVISYSTAVRACETGDQWELALSLLRQMPEVRLEPDEINFSAAISACEKCGQWQAAVAILEEMSRARLVPNGLDAGTVGNAMRKALGNEAAMSLLGGLLKLWQGQPATPENCQLRGDQHAEQEEPEEGSRIQVLRSSAGVVALFKPAGMTSESAVRQLSQQRDQTGAVTHTVGLDMVSRLDKPTSGVMPVALGSAESPAAKWLQAQFASRLVAKEYICLCEGPSLGAIGTTGEVRAPLVTVPRGGVDSWYTEVSPLGREAHTCYEVLARYAPPAELPGTCTTSELMLLLVRPLTGRTHQIRVHLASLGRPLVGEPLYGAATTLLPGCPRLFLHCQRISLTDLQGAPFVAEAQVPAEPQLQASTQSADFRTPGNHHREDNPDTNNLHICKNDHGYQRFSKQTIVVV